VELEERAPVDWVPEVAIEPVQAPVAVQPDASVEDQVSIVEAPVEMEVLAACRWMVGAGVEVPLEMFTVTDCWAEPPAPVQARV